MTIQDPHYDDISSNDLAQDLIRRARMARISILQLQKNAGVGNTTVHRWNVSKTGVFCKDTASKLMAAMAEAEAKNAEWEASQ